MRRVIGFLADTGSSRNSQVNALKNAGCSDVQRHGILSDETINDLHRGDELVVWRIQELGLSALELIELIGRLSAERIGFRSLVDGIDTTNSPSVGEFCLLLTLLRRKAHKDRVTEGIKLAQEAGRRYGRTRKLSESDVEVIQEVIRRREISVTAAARQFGVSRGTLQRYLSEARKKVQSANNTG